MPVARNQFVNQLILSLLSIPVFFGHNFFSQVYDPHTIFRTGSEGELITFPYPIKPA
jgi:hypothetical protein